MASINGETKLFGLLSHGATFTLSPAMHNAAAKAFFKNQIYLHFDLKHEKVANFLDVFWHLGCQGLNITMPHKSYVASLVECNGLKSVNTLVRTDRGWQGHSTDGEGFLRGLNRAHKTILDFDMVIMMGSGGSAQAILNAISNATTDAPLLHIIHRRSKNNDSLMLEALTGNPVQITTFRNLNPESFTNTLKETTDQRRLIIQATSGPKSGENFSSYIDALNHLTPNDLIVDIIYDRPSDFYFAAIAKNLNCLDGMPMLIEQARLSQFLWWGKAASYQEMADAIKNSGWQG